MRLSKYFYNIQQDLKLFFFILFVIVLYRVFFMWYMSGYMSSGIGSEDVWLAFFAGLRLSLKSAGAVALLSFVFCTLVGILFPRVGLDWLRSFFGCAAAFVLSVLFEARFPYYREYGETFNLQILQGLHDDKWAIFVTTVEEYGFVWRFFLAVALAFVAFRILKKLLSLETFSLPSSLERRNYYVFARGNGRKKAAAWLVLVGFTFLFMLFVRFGGSFNYEHGINWENSAVTGDSFLNECVLDDFQALYRAHATEKRMRAGHISGVDKNKTLEYAEFLSGKNGAAKNDLGFYLERKADGAKIPKPRHIFIILGETYAQWPMLEKYADLHVADGIKKLAARDDAYYTPNFMPNGDFTSIAITGLVTGLADVNIRANYQPRSFEAPYITAMAPQFKKLGYNVDFWYGGTPAWDNINKLAKAQGFDNFYGYPDFHAPKQSTWGTTDGHLFAALAKHLPTEPPTVHLVMTVSNHPPYNIDLAKEGFDVQKETEAVGKMENVDDAEQLASELGHYWYMDKTVTEFAEKTLAQYPDSLFVITGDHAVRMNPGTKPTMFEQQSVPCVIVGGGVTKNILPPGAVGGHIDMVPTVIRLIAPQDFSYFSLTAGLTENKIAFNRTHWLDGNSMGEIDGARVESLPYSSGGASRLSDELMQRIRAIRTLSWQLLENGTEIK